MAISRRSFLGCTALLVPALSFARTGSRALLAKHLQSTTTPGMAALVIRDFQAENEWVTGVRRLGATAKVRRGDRWHLGSNGKAIVATMIARLVASGELSWSRPLAEMLPQFASTMDERYRDVTLPDLLSHRAGLIKDLSEKDPDFHYVFHADKTPPPEQRLRYVDRVLLEPPVAEKRKGFSYSNMGFVTAAACAEQATGKSFEALMADQIFQPLGMSDVSFEQYGDQEGPAGHRDGRIADQTRDVMPRMFVPAGGMRMSLQSWARFCIDQMQGEHGRGKLLDQESYRLLHTPQGDSGFAALGWGWLQNAFERKGPALFHAGSDGNWTALVMLFPQTGNGVLVASNAFESMSGDRAANETMRAIVPLIAEAEAKA
jgi:CubicO group peptidase (beta-lactamase class C family)